MDPLPEAVEDLAQDELRTGIDVDVPLGNANLRRDQLPQRGRVGLGLVVAARQFRPGWIVNRANIYSLTPDFCYLSAVGVACNGLIA